LENFPIKMTESLDLFRRGSNIVAPALQGPYTIDLFGRVDGAPGVEVDVPLEYFIAGLEIVDVPPERLLETQLSRDVSTEMPAEDREFVVQPTQDRVDALLAIDEDVIASAPTVPVGTVTVDVATRGASLEGKLDIADLLLGRPHVIALEVWRDVEEVFRDGTRVVERKVPPGDVYGVRRFSRELGDILEVEHRVTGYRPKL
jgi:hypothetical protein